ncbi:MAG: IS110 family transposase [Candidatus Dormibacteraceae bacterium]
MTTISRMPETNRKVTIGVDTHCDVNVAAALDEHGRLLETQSFPTSAAGHRELERWAMSLGTILALGIEGTGAYGVGLTRHLTLRGHQIFEVDRPNRQTRYRRGKSDTVDAEAAARAVLSGTATGQPKRRDGKVEAIRALRVSRRSALKARNQTINQMRCLIASAPEEIRERLRGLSRHAFAGVCARFRVCGVNSAADASKYALRSLARRYEYLTTEIQELDSQLEPLLKSVCPELMQIRGVGPDVAGQLLVTAGENPERLRSESAFAHLCGVAPIPVASGRTDRVRLNRGGDRQANAALYRVILNRLRWDGKTIAYCERRTAEGRSKKEIIRCLKRYVAREVFPVLQKAGKGLDNA